MMNGRACLVFLLACTPDPLAPTEPNISVVPHDPDTTRELQVFFVSQSTDEDSETIDYLYEWEVDGEVRAHLTEGIVPATETLKGENWVVKVRATDGENTSTTAMAMTYIVNSPPSAELLLSPDAPLASDVVSAQLTLTDADEDEIDVTYHWSLDGALTTYTEASLPAEATQRGDVWSLTVVPSDDEAEGEPVTAEVNIENSPPSIASLVLSPEPVGVDDTATAWAEGVDDDGDPLQFDYQWQVDGVEVLTGPEPTLSMAPFEKGQSVMVTVTANDGFVDSDPMSLETQIANTVPTVSLVEISPAEPTASDTLSCTYVFDDADGDSDFSSLEWTVNDTPVISPDGLSSGDEVRCIVTPNDGEELGTVVEDLVRVGNALPVVSSVILAPTEIGTEDTVVATPSATDADGDDIDFEYDWYVNGTWVTSGSDSLDGTTWFDKDDEVYVEVTPFDATSLGTPLSSDSIIVGNTAPGAPVVAIDPASPVEGAEPLICEIDTEATDPDGDILDYALSWTVDGVAFTDTETTTLTDDTIPSDQHFEGELWVCAALPDDGEDWGEIGEASVEIMGPDVVTDFALEDVNKTSVYYGMAVSPRDTLEQVSGWYFGHAT